MLEWNTRVEQWNGILEYQYITQYIQLVFKIYTILTLVGAPTTITGGMHVNHSNIWLPQEPLLLMCYMHYKAVSLVTHSPDTVALLQNPFKFMLTFVAGNISS